MSINALGVVGGDRGVMAEQTAWYVMRAGVMAMAVTGVLIVKNGLTN